MLPLPEKIETDRLTIQRLRYEDAEEIFYVYSSKPEATKYVSWPTHQSVQETRRFLDYAIKAWNSGTEYSYSIRLKETGLLIGSIAAINDAGNVSIGYILGPNHWSKGYLTEGCKGLVIALQGIPQIYRIWTVVDVDNVASSRVLLKCGFIEEARLSKWFRFINQDNRAKDCFIYKLP
jgi:ribosomal-protein-alanine N-acetyltransferase